MDTRNHLFGNDNSSLSKISYTNEDLFEFAKCGNELAVQGVFVNGEHYGYKVDASYAAAGYAYVGKKFDATVGMMIMRPDVNHALVIQHHQLAGRPERAAQLQKLVASKKCSFNPFLFSTQAGSPADTVKSAQNNVASLRHC